MTAELTIVLEKLDKLSYDELLTVQEQIIQYMRNIQSPAATSTQLINRRITIPGAYRPTKDQIEAHLKAVFSPQQLAEIKTVDLTHIPPGKKTVTEILNEDREDRF